MFVIAAMGTPLTVLGLQITEQDQKRLENRHIKKTEFSVEKTTSDTFMEKQEGKDYRDPQMVTYHSGITGTDRQAMVFLPADYNEKSTYPVLYLLHGMGGSYVTWNNKNASVILQNLYNEHKAKEMIVVCVDSNVNPESYTDEDNLSELITAYDKTGDDLIGFLKPYIEAHFPVKKGRMNTAIAGYSMGGRNAIAIAFAHQELFGYLGAFSPENVVKEMKINTQYTPVIDNLAIQKGTGGFRLFLLVVGNRDDDCGYVSYDLEEYLQEKSIDHIFYDMDGGHENSVWQNALYNFSRYLFQ